MFATDDSIRDPALLRRIEKDIIGEKPDVLVKFYVHAERDHKAEAEQRKRINEGSDEIARPFFKEALYIHKKVRGKKDSVSSRATDKDKREFEREWEQFQAIRDLPQKHHISLLPGCGVCALAVFDELNIEYIEDFMAFCEAKPEILDIFEELRPLLENAKRWRTFMKPRLKLVNGKASNGHH